MKRARRRTTCVYRNEHTAFHSNDDSPRTLWNGVAPYFRYLGAVDRDERSRGVLWGKSEKIVERLGPRRREGLCRALQHFMVDHPR